MQIAVLENKQEVGRAAGKDAAGTLGRIIEARGEARIVVATGASMFEFLETLTQAPGIDWSKVEMFHLDEYVGLSEEHPASFRRYLRERFINKVKLGAYHLLDDEAAAQRIAKVIAQAPVDLAFVGIGENGHLAFNDPPADFETEAPYLVVELDEACRRQQVGEGWYGSIEEVPTRAVSMSVRQILKAGEIICIVPESRKAEAVRASLEGPISPMVPASILRTHPDVRIYLDKASAALLTASMPAR